MKSQYEKIIQNEQLFSELASKQFIDSEDITRSNLKSILQERSSEIRSVINNTNDLISEFILPFLLNVNLIDEESAKELEELANALSGYKENLDTGLAYEIRKALADWAKLKGDESMYIINTFFKGLALFYLDSGLFKDEMNECYEIIINYSDRYTEFDEKTRNIIARAFGNYYISTASNQTDERIRRIDLAIDFWENTAKKVDPSFPWNSYILNAHDNLCSAIISALRSSEHSTTITQEHKKRCYESALELNKNISPHYLKNNNDYTSSEVKNVYYLYAAEYYYGLISAKELVDFLYSIYKQADNEYSYDNIYKKFHISALYFYYLKDVSEEEFSQEERENIFKEIETDIYNYAEHIPYTFSRSHVTRMLGNFATAANIAFDDLAYLKMILSLTVFRHTPTYAHSIMVGKIAFVIAEFMIEHMPEEFVGMPGFDSVDDVTKNLGEILLFVWYSSLVHDIGKIVYSHVVSFYARKLNDKEFEMIKQHTVRSKGFIKTSPDFDTASEVSDMIRPLINFDFKNNPELFSKFSDVALGHHKSYDGKFGYPETFDNTASSVKTIIDIITLADSIDAATDSIGRSYAKEKTLEDMRQDLLSQIGTRYSPRIANLIFDNQDLYDAINHILLNDRYDTYYSCFKSNDFSQTMVPPKRILI